jgi:hypothetical protein
MSDITGPIVRPEDVEIVRTNLFELARNMVDSGWMSAHAYDSMEVTDRERYSGKVNHLRRPVHLAASNCARFVIYQDVLRSHAREFDQHLDGPLNGREKKNLALAYSAASALGEYALRRHINDPGRSRSKDRMVRISELMTDREDFTEHFQGRITDEALKGLMSVVDDSALVEINGLRAGMTIVRSAVKDSMGSDFMIDDLVLACNSGLEQYIGNIGPKYTATSRYLGVGEERGVGTFSYAIPEWLLVLGVPMSTEKLSTIFTQDLSSEFGSPDMNWTPVQGM